jgi:preprotein translocase subunit SecA
MKQLYSIQKIRELSSQPIAGLIEAARDTVNPGRYDYAFAACCNACHAGIGLTPFDEQITAAWALYHGKVIEMKTGEGKTISAVFAAFLQVLDGRRVHILTYNDYLVKRDYNWMKPIYELLGINVSYIVEGMSAEQRKQAYLSAVVYNTAKECGFDFLRDFVADKPDDVLHEDTADSPAFDCAIVDEADSILIDEARIPLIIAGSVAVQTDAELEAAFAFVKTLGERDYGLSDEDETSYLTDGGIEKAEAHFGVNLYDEENQSLLSDLNDCLKANFSLKEDVNYIVKGSDVLIIDEFTGRAAKNRRYPGALHSAVEIKHGIKAERRGVVMGSVALQYFIRQYKHLSGMTGTVFPSEEEFELLYDLKPEKIPTHNPSQRNDHPMEIYYNAELKQAAIINEIIRAHERGQPILAGAESIEESEALAEELRKAGINAAVLNAKNDESEAEIIKNAGVEGAVTISTSMAGRGVDILLGGTDQSSREAVVNAGGLYVISTSMRESSRINRQLRGRAGRQGDVGESKVFTALDDEIMLKYELLKLLPGRRFPAYTEEAVTDKAIVREVGRIQRISEGERLEERKRLLKFSAISEKHRDAVFRARKKFVTGESVPTFWQDFFAIEYDEAVSRYGSEAVNDLQREVIVAVLNEAWSDYLVYMSALREGIHLTSVGGKSPTDEFNVTCQKYYEEMEERVIDEMSAAIERLLGLESIAEFIITKPESVYTYLQNESADELVKKPLMIQAVEGARLIGDEDEPELSGRPPKKGFWGRLFS